MNRHHKKCKLKESGSNEENVKGASPEKTTKTNKVNRNKRKQLSKTDSKEVTVKKNKDLEKLVTKSKTFVQKRKKETEQPNPTVIQLKQSIANCLKSLDMKEDDDDDTEEKYESDEGDYL